MLNVTHKLTGTKLVIEVDLSKPAIAKARPSTTGKTMLLASTNGAADLPLVEGRKCTFALNVMMKP